MDWTLLKWAVVKLQLMDEGWRQEGFHVAAGQKEIFNTNYGDTSSCNKWGFHPNRMDRKTSVFARRRAKTVCVDADCKSDHSFILFVHFIPLLFTTLKLTLLSSVQNSQSTREISINKYGKCYKKTVFSTLKVPARTSFEIILICSLIVEKMPSSNPDTKQKLWACWE